MFSDECYIPDIDEGFIPPINSINFFDNIGEGYESNSSNNIESMELIGQGSYGKVYRITRPGISGYRALKVIKLEKHEQGMIFNEIRCLSRIKSDYVTKFYGAWEETDPEEFGKTRYCIEMEYFDGITLMEWMSMRKSFDIVKSTRIMQQIAKGLANIHSFSVIHRDFSPSNILINQNEQIKIIDFGLSDFAKDQPRRLIPPRPESVPHTYSLMINPIKAIPIPVESSSVSTHGTPLYRSPEQKNGKKPSTTDDIYSFGIIIYEFFAMFKTRMELFKSIPNLTGKGQLPVRFEECFPVISNLIRSMIKNDANKRPSASVVYEQLCEEICY